MIAFDVPDMSCGHCVATIDAALKRADPQAAVRIDLASHRIEVEPGDADPDELLEAIREAGYSPVPAAAGRALP